MVLARRRTVPRPSRQRYRQNGAWKGHDDYFVGPIPPVDHLKALRDTGWLSEVFREMYNEAAVQVKPEAVIRALKRAGVKFVLMGAHAVNGWTRVARATRDVDALVQKSHHKKAVRAIQAAFPELTPEDNPVVTRFRDAADGEVAIDLMKPTDEIHKAVIKNSVLVRLSHLVPNLEMVLACKFAAMVSPNRQEPRKHMDAADFGLLVKHNKDDINRERLRALGETVYAGGGKEVMKLVDDVLAGRPLVF